jgi:molybdenum cofactor cytidylyltransferase
MMIPALVLAAGRSSRMGRAKATLPVDEHDTFLSRIVRTFLSTGIDDVVIVLGHDADFVRKSFAKSGLPARFALNREYDRGQLSSIRTGLSVIDRPGVTAMLLTLVDVPLVSPSTVASILARYRETAAPIVRPIQGTRHGHPILVDRSLFDVIRAGDDQQGLKPIVRTYSSTVGDVVVDDEGAFMDIDTMEDYRRVIGVSIADARG